MNAISKNSFTELKNGIVLAELGGYGDDPYCAKHGAGGGIKDMEGARRVWEQGADAVAIGTAAMKEAALCGDIQKRLK